MYLLFFVKVFFEFYIGVFEEWEFCVVVGCCFEESVVWVCWVVGGGRYFVFLGSVLYGCVFVCCWWGWYVFVYLGIFGWIWDVSIVWLMKWKNEIWCVVGCCGGYCFVMWLCWLGYLGFVIWCGWNVGDNVGVVVGKIVSCYFWFFVFLFVKCLIL